MHGLCIVKLFQNSVYTDNNNNKLLLEGKAKLKSHTSTVAIYISCQNLNLIPLLWQYILSKLKSHTSTVVKYISYQNLNLIPLL